MGVWVKHLNVRYHQQDTSYYCGPATAQMILHAPPVSVGYIDQDDLYDKIHNTYNTPDPGANWATNPDGLEGVLNFYKSLNPTFDSANHFVVFSKDTENEASRKIVDTLKHFNVATGTLVFAGGHWIAVRGVQTDSDPNGGSYSIDGFWVNNPWPPTPSLYDPTLAPPPPHSDTDPCGTGLPVNGYSTGIADEYISYSDWQSTYLTAVSVGTNWLNKYVSVCDPKPPKVGELIPRGIKLKSDGIRILDDETATKFSLEGFEEHMLKKYELYAEAFEKSKPSRPELVHRLDRPGEFYHLVPFHEEEKIRMFLRVDGRYGNFLGGRAYPTATEHVVLTRKQVEEIITKRPINVVSRSPRLTWATAEAVRELVPLRRIYRLKVRPGTYCIHPIKVWKPCQESRSPYYPFHMITVAGYRLYIGYDGTVYDTLHDLGPGG